VYSLHPIKRWRYRRFPGPRPWPLVGNLVTILREGQEAAVSRWAAQHGSPFLFWLGGVPVVMVDDPQMARQNLHWAWPTAVPGRASVAAGCLQLDAKRGGGRVLAGRC
jgi:hypothetical protein